MILLKSPIAPRASGVGRPMWPQASRCAQTHAGNEAHAVESPPNLGEAADQCSVSQLPSALDLNRSIRYRTFFQAAYRRGIPRRLRIMSHYDNRLFELPV